MGISTTIQTQTRMVCSQSWHSSCPVNRIHPRLFWSARSEPVLRFECFVCDECISLSPRFRPASVISGRPAPPFSNHPFESEIRNNLPSSRSFFRQGGTGGRHFPTSYAASSPAFRQNSRNAFRFSRNFDSPWKSSPSASRFCPVCWGCSFAMETQRRGERLQTLEGDLKTWFRIKRRMF